jgi:hypothetical protein
MTKQFLQNTINGIGTRGSRSKNRSCNGCSQCQKAIGATATMTTITIAQTTINYDLARAWDDLPGKRRDGVVGDDWDK